MSDMIILAHVLLQNDDILPSRMRAATNQRLRRRRCAGFLSKCHQVAARYHGIVRIQ